MMFALSGNPESHYNTRQVEGCPGPSANNIVMKRSLPANDVLGGLASAAVAIPLAMGYGMFAFAPLGEDRGNRSTRPRLDLTIGIQKATVQTIGQDLAHRRFARGSVTHQGQARSAPGALALGEVCHSSRRGPSLRLRVAPITSSGASCPV